MDPKVLDEIVGRRSWILSRMARWTYLAFLCFYIEVSVLSHVIGGQVYTC